MALPTDGDITVSTSGGGIASSGIAVSAVPLLGANNTFTGTNAFSDDLTASDGTYTGKLYLGSAKTSYLQNQGILSGSAAPLGTGYYWSLGSTDGNAGYLLGASVGSYSVSSCIAGGLAAINGTASQGQMSAVGSTGCGYSDWINSTVIEATTPPGGSTGNNLVLDAFGSGNLVFQQNRTTVMKISSTAATSNLPFAAPSYSETLTTPASSSAACTAGQFTDDANYHYVCVATNTWKRVALTGF
jgi:hypothetical protein